MPEPDDRVTWDDAVKVITAILVLQIVGTLVAVGMVVYGLVTGNIG